MHRIEEQWIKSHLCWMWSINRFLKCIFLHFNSFEILHIGHKNLLVSPLSRSQAHFCLTPKLADSYRLCKIVYVFSEITQNFSRILSKNSLSYQLRGSAWKCHWQFSLSLMYSWADLSPSRTAKCVTGKDKDYFEEALHRKVSWMYSPRTK